MRMLWTIIILYLEQRAEIVYRDKNISDHGGKKNKAFFASRAFNLEIIIARQLHIFEIKSIKPGHVMSQNPAVQVLRIVTFGTA